VDRHYLINTFQSYKTSFSEEEKFISFFLELLPQQDCFLRMHLPGHITGSAWIVNHDRSKALLVHHAKLNRWVQPGGHADGDENILRVALREAEEETGLKNFKVDKNIFDIDIHLIPARKDFTEHFHYDIRFLIEGDENEKIIVSDESHDVKWILINDLEKFTTERSVLRMKDKLLHG